MKEARINARGAVYDRIPVKTRLILKGDDLLEAIAEGLAESSITIRDDDILFVSEKAVGASQGRYFVLDDGALKPRRLARLLSRFVTRSPSGIGLGMPETMECALRECGTVRILFAAFVGALGKLAGRRGDFYRVAGHRARSIDGPTSGTIPPFNNAVSLAPDDPEGVSETLSNRFGCSAAVVDINDLGGNILGAYPPELDRKLLIEVLRDNPLGQGHESTPAGLIRPSRVSSDPA
jgi:hypothetical protein